MMTPAGRLHRAQFMSVVCPPHFSRRLLYSSSLTAVSVCSALYNELPENGVLATLVLVCSLNYWRHPVFGWRRNVDMAAAGTGLLYQLGVSAPQADEPARTAYACSVALCCGCYGFSRFFAFTCQNYNASSLWHAALHCCGNGGNLLLYDALGRQRRSLAAPRDTT